MSNWPCPTASYVQGCCSPGVLLGSVGPGSLVSARCGASLIQTSCSLINRFAVFWASKSRPNSCSDSLHENIPRPSTMHYRNRRGRRGFRSDDNVGRGCSEVIGACGKTIGDCNTDTSRRTCGHALVRGHCYGGISLDGTTVSRSNCTYSYRFQILHPPRFINLFN